jgi:hypothetical protein
MTMTTCNQIRQREERKDPTKGEAQNDATFQPPIPPTAIAMGRFLYEHTHAHTAICTDQSNQCGDAYNRTSYSWNNPREKTPCDKLLSISERYRMLSRNSSRAKVGRGEEEREAPAQIHCPCTYTKDSIMR